MEVLGRANAYKSLIQNESTRLSTEIRRLVELNERILRDIEPLFLQENSVEDKESRFSYIIHSIINEGTNMREATAIANYNKLLKELVDIENSKKRVSNRFNALIKALSEFNDSEIDGMVKRGQSIFENEELNFKEYKKNAYKAFLEEHFRKQKQVFLSYAYEDKLYTIALFFLFQKQDIFLFVDWMNNGEEEKGIQLKRKLHEALNKSEQLVFLRTPNSELKIGGNYYVRPWCSWELGNFYDRLGSKDKFFIDLYEHGEIDNLQLSGIKVLTGITNGILSGRDLEGA